MTEINLEQLAAQLNKLHDGGAGGFSDDALALRFAEKCGGDVRYVAAWARWYHWQDTHWGQEKTLLAYNLVRSLVRDAARGINGSGAKSVASGHTVHAIASLARTDRRIAATEDQWDRDPWLLNTPSGVVNLKTGDMRAHHREDYITQITAVGPTESPRPMWDAFLKTVTDDDVQLIAYLQRVAGYCLTGMTTEQALFFLYGLGRNGKGVFVNTLVKILADYHAGAPLDMLITKKQENHPTELAGLMGKRLVTTAETEPNRRWAEAKLKQLTGGDFVSARFMRGDFFTYMPDFKLVIAGNHKPALHSVGVAMRRRFNLVPFTVTIPEAQQDPALTQKLGAEHASILQWAIEGCLEWREHGLAPPKCVVEATDRYFAEQNTIKTFLMDCCVEDPQCETSATSLYSAWKDWAVENGEFVGSQKLFSQRLQDMGVPVRLAEKGTLYRGYRLR